MMRNQASTTKPPAGSYCGGNSAIIEKFGQPLDEPAWLINLGLFVRGSVHVLYIINDQGLCTWLESLKRDLSSPWQSFQTRSPSSDNISSP